MLRQFKGSKNLYVMTALTLWFLIATFRKDGCLPTSCFRVGVFIWRVGRSSNVVLKIESFTQEQCGLKQDITVRRSLYCSNVCQVCNIIFARFERAHFCVLSQFKQPLPNCSISKNWMKLEIQSYLTNVFEEESCMRHGVIKSEIWAITSPVIMC